MTKTESDGYLTGAGTPKLLGILCLLTFVNPVFGTCDNPNCGKWLTCFKDYKSDHKCDNKVGPCCLITLEDQSRRIKTETPMFRCSGGCDFDVCIDCYRGRLMHTIEHEHVGKTTIYKKGDTIVKFQDRDNFLNANLMFRETHIQGPVVHKKDVNNGNCDEFFIHYKATGEYYPIIMDHDKVLPALLTRLFKCLSFSGNGSVGNGSETTCSDTNETSDISIGDESFGSNYWKTTSKLTREISLMYNVRDGSEQRTEPADFRVMQEGSHLRLEAWLTRLNRRCFVFGRHYIVKDTIKGCTYTMPNNERWEAVRALCDELAKTRAE